MREPFASIGLLLLRVSVSLAMISQHGLSKLLSFSERAASFPDPLGVSSPVSLGLAVLGELVAPALLILGLFTRFAAVPATVTMLVAALVVHGDDPFKKQELPLLYATCFATLMLCGAGKYSLDRRIRRKP